MDEKEAKKNSKKQKHSFILNLYIFIIGVVIVFIALNIIAQMSGYHDVVSMVKGEKKQTVAKKSNEANTTVENEIEKEENVPSSLEEYFILYDGYEIELNVGVQDLTEMKIDDKSNEKYNTTYYNYINSKYVGESEGVFGEGLYEEVSAVANVDRIAISEKYDATPREYTELNELPEQLTEMADYSSVDIHSIDLDGDGEEEFVICYTVNYGEGEIGNEEPQASSGIMLADSECERIANLVTLENGFWGNIKEEDKKVFLSLEDIEYIDIDNDGIIEIIIKVPTYEGTKISILKYNDGLIEGETNINASVIP